MNRKILYYIIHLALSMCSCEVYQNESPTDTNEEVKTDITLSVNNRYFYGNAYIEAFEVSEVEECRDRFDYLNIVASDEKNKSQIHLKLKLKRDQNTKNLPSNQIIGYGVSTDKREEQLSFLYLEENTMYSSEKGFGNIVFLKDRVRFSLEASTVLIDTGYPPEEEKILSISGETPFEYRCYNKTPDTQKPCQSWNTLNSIDSGYCKNHILWLKEG